MARYTVNERAIEQARELIEAGQYVLESDWAEVRPNPREENAYLSKHSWDDSADWHLGLNVGANDQTKARYGFAFGDFRRVHRSAIIACWFRAAQWRHKAIEKAANDLLQTLDKKAGIG